VPSPSATRQQTFPNGLTLLGEHMPHVRSATLYFLVPAGFTREPADKLGLSPLVAELVTRGAGELNSVDLSLALDNLGADRSESAGPFNTVFSAGTLGRNLLPVLGLYADIIRRPHLPDDELDAARDLLLQDLLGLEDSPDEKVMLELGRRYYPKPLSRNRYGTQAGLESITPADVRAFHAERFQADGAILSVAGAIDWDALVDKVGTLFGDWPGHPAPDPVPGPHTPTSGHVTQDTQQTQITLACPSAAFADPDFYAARAAVGVLSGGMSSRLFTEVREKRGLCYSVRASHSTVKDRGTVVCYAGSRTDRAQETLDVTVAELKRLREGVTADELQRLKASLKTSLVMQQDSVASRAASMASDWFYLNRVRPVEEVSAAVDAIDEPAIMGYLDRFPMTDLTVVTLGPTPLTLPA